MKSLKNDKKLIHDINASISSITHALEILYEDKQENTFLQKKMMPLLVNKIKLMNLSWEELKKEIRIPTRQL